jgi:hypothetical protein
MGDRAEILQARQAPKVYGAVLNAEYKAAAHYQKVMCR